jgi:hypothetical protein
MQTPIHTSSGIRIQDLSNGVGLDSSWLRLRRHCDRLEYDIESFFPPVWCGVEPSPLLLRPLTVLLYQPRMMMGEDEWSSRWKDWQGEPKYSEKTCSNAT